MSYKTVGSRMESSVVAARDGIADALLNSPLPKGDLLRNLGLFLLPMDLKRFLFFDSLYRQLVSTPGIIVEFGCRWGQNLAILQCLRAIYEPYNHLRTIVGIDTFAGLRRVTEKDGKAEPACEGAYAVPEGYEAALEALLALRETQSPMSGVRKFQILKGDAPRAWEGYLRDHPETIVAFAYFDMDIYQPTVECLRLLGGRLTKGSIVGFDELAMPEFPGETAAFREAVGTGNVRLQRNAWCSSESYFVVE
jgi:hypothetical protein